MKSFSLLGIIVVVSIQYTIQAAGPDNLFIPSEIKTNENCISYLIPQIYDSLQGEKPSYAAFYVAMEGFLNLKNQGVFKNDKILTLIDYSLSSLKKRLWVIDIANKKILFNQLVAHGMNSGSEFAEHFSNTAESYMSSLGFYITGETYNGKNGLSLQLEGIEKGFNDNAKSRAIVIHMAKYVSQGYINEYGHLGRSFGCPSIPAEGGKSIIDTLAGGSCLFIYYPDDTYLSASRIINDNSMETGPLSSK